MNPIRNILVIVDPTAEEHPAIRKGALLAEKLNARLELFVCETKASRQVGLAKHARNNSKDLPVVNVRAKLEELADPLRNRGLDVTTATEIGDPLYAALTERTKRTTADLVIKDTHHHSLVKRTFLTNTDWHLIRTCPVPLLLTKATSWPVIPRVFAAVDPGHANDKPAALDYRILDYASLLSKKLDGELHVVHAYLPAAIVAGAIGSSPEIGLTICAEDLAVEEQQMRRRVEELVAEYRVESANVHLEVGGPADAIPLLAGALQATIMTMGALSRSGVERAFIGSTAEGVLEQLPCDALIVKPPDFAAMLPF